MNLSLRKEAQEEKRYLVDVTLNVLGREDEMHDLELALTDVARDNGGELLLSMNCIMWDLLGRPMFKQQYAFDERAWWNRSASQMFHEILSHNFLGSVSMRAERLDASGDWLPTPDDAQGVRFIEESTPEQPPEESGPYEPLIEPDELES